MRALFASFRNLHLGLLCLAVLSFAPSVSTAQGRDDLLELDNQTRGASAQQSFSRGEEITKTLMLPAGLRLRGAVSGGGNFRSKEPFSAQVTYTRGSHFARVTPAGGGRSYYVWSNVLARHSQEFADCWGKETRTVRTSTRSNWWNIGRAARTAANSTPYGRYALNAGKSAIRIGRKALNALSAYAQDQRVKCMIDRCKRRMSKTRGGLCLKNVRQHAQNCGLIRGSGGIGASASKVGPRLKREGYINLMDDPKLGPLISQGGIVNNPAIPKGAIMQFDGTNCGRSQRPRLCALGKGHGHIEIKTGDNAYCYDRQRSVAGGAAQIAQPGLIEGGSGTSRRRMKAVWVKADAFPEGPQ